MSGKTLRTAAIATAILLAGCGKGPESTTATPTAGATEATSNAPAPAATPTASPSASGTATPATGFEKGFRQGFAKQFVESCVQSASAQGAPVAKVTPVCECAADELGKQFGVDQLMSLKEEQAMPVLKICAQRNGITPR